MVYIKKVLIILLLSLCILLLVYWRGCVYKDSSGIVGKFSVLYKEYDAMNEIGTDYKIGAAQKRYYYFGDEKGIHEYGAKQITEADFLQYNEADEIIKKVVNEYKINDSSPC